MKPRINELLAKFALDENHKAISQAFILKNKVSVEEQRALYDFIAMILRGFIFADAHTQEIIEMLGEANKPVEDDSMVTFAIAELNRIYKDRDPLDLDGETDAEAA